MILVTGASGFVGRHLCRDLDNRQIAFRPAARSSSQGHFAVGTIDPTTDWSAALAGIRIVVHLAARVHVMNETQADPLASFRAMNVEATINLARQAAHAGATRFVFVSSIKVNGEHTLPGQHFSANDAPAPQDPYGISKAEAEKALLELGKETGMEIAIIRPPLIYGKGVGANFHLLQRWAGSGIPSPFGMCRNRRSLVFVGNLIDLIIRACEHPSAANQIFLASDGNDLSTQELFSLLARAQGRAGVNIPVPEWILRSTAQCLGKKKYTDRLLNSLQLDIAKTRDLLSWDPPFSVEAGIRATVAQQSDSRRLI